MSEAMLPYHILFLREEFSRRQSKNPRYSLRAFSHALKVHPSAMSRILQCKQELSLRACVAIVPKIVFTDKEKHDFLLSVAEEKMRRAAAFLARTLKIQIDIGTR